MARQVFYSFHYQPDSTRAAKIRNIGKIAGNKPANDNDWEKVAEGGDAAIKKWIDEQLQGRSCTLILAGTGTANRKWINYEIETSWNKGMGVAVINIHGITNLDGHTAAKGNNPLDGIIVEGQNLKSIAKRHDPPGKDRSEKYNWISNNIEQIIEEAIQIRKNF